VSEVEDPYLAGALGEAQRTIFWLVVPDTARATRDMVAGHEEVIRRIFEADAAGRTAPRIDGERARHLLNALLVELGADPLSLELARRLGFVAAGGLRIVTRRFVPLVLVLVHQSNR
jgi:hypothetical protein